MAGGHKIDPKIDIADCGYDNETTLSIFSIFKYEHNFSHDPKLIQRAASDMLHQWISNTPSASSYRTSSKFSKNTRCAYCGAFNILRAWPHVGDSIPFYYLKLEELQYRPGGYLIDVSCHKCSKVWCVVWDSSPIWASSTSEEISRYKDALRHYNAAVDHNDAGGQEAALADYSHAIELDPTMVNAYTKPWKYLPSLGTRYRRHERLCART